VIAEDSADISIKNSSSADYVIGSQSCGSDWGIAFTSSKISKNDNYILDIKTPTGTAVGSACVYRYPISGIARGMWDDVFGQPIGGGTVVGGTYRYNDYDTGISTGGYGLGIYRATLKPNDATACDYKSPCFDTVEVVECIDNSDCTSPETCDTSSNSCVGGGGGGGGGGDSCTGTVTGKVFQADATTPMEGVTVSASPTYGGASDTTDASGNYTLTNVSSSNCSAILTASAACDTVSIGVTLVDGGSVTKNFILTNCGTSLCAAIGDDCETNNDCCSKNCDGNTNKCISGSGPITPPRCDPNSGVYCNPLDEVNTLSKAAETFLGYVLGLIGSVALLFLIIAGVMYMTSAGSEERIATSKRILTGAIIGLGIALLAYSLLKVIVDILNAP
jgi:hypothetical protein